MLARNEFLCPFRIDVVVLFVDHSTSAQSHASTVQDRAGHMRSQPAIDSAPDRFSPRENRADPGSTEGRKARVRARAAARVFRDSPQYVAPALARRVRRVPTASTDSSPFRYPKSAPPAGLRMDQTLDFVFKAISATPIFQIACNARRN